MAVDVDRLFPPNIAGTLPSFYTELDGTTRLVVPFSMNQSVSVASVKGFFLRLKRTTTDTLLGILDTQTWDQENLTVTFQLPKKFTDRMTTGDYYKVQIAYHNYTPSGAKYCGHYSTVAIVKYTEQPTIGIQGLVSGQVNSIAAQQFSGRYSNSDISEKAYQYRFHVISSYTNTLGKFVEETLTDTGWLIHNSSEDSSLTESIDILILTELLTVGVTYTIQYQVITNNGLQVSSPQYVMVATENLGEELPCIISPKLDYENARMRLTTRSIYGDEIPAGDLPSEEKVKYYFNGNYRIVRTDSKSNFKTWTLLFTFQSFSPFKDWEYYDYVIESGVAYKYGIQRINANGVLSARKETYQNIAAYFEDAYFYDGERQLRIRYNTNVSSIKDVIAESKKTTLGSKYPYILRNGYLNYKEFPVTGVLSYLSDPQELFMTKNELIHPTVLASAKSNQTKVDSYSFEETTDQTDENVTAEKNFAMTAMNWLNNGSIKLFKSSQEGNYIVKCLNVSLTPLNNTNRMIHNFQCTVDEVQEYTTTALLKYDIINLGTADEEGHVWVPTYEDIAIHVVRDAYMQSDPVLQTRRPVFADYDYTKGYYITKIEITQATPGDLFTYGGNMFAIPQSGKYTIVNQDPIIQPLKKVYIVTGTTIINGEQVDTVLPTDFGQTDQGYIRIYYNVDTSIGFETVSKEIVRTYFGWSAYGMELTDNGQQSSNILWEFAGPKKTVINEYSKVIHSYPIHAGVNIQNYANASQASINDYGVKYGGYLQLRDNGQTPDKYYIYSNDQNEFIEYPNYDLNIRVGSPESNLINIKAYSTEGQAVPDIDYINKTNVYWTVGSNVWVIFYFQVQETNYAIESTNTTVAASKADAEAAKKAYLTYLWNFETISNRPNDGTQVYIYSNERFSPIQLTEWDNYAEHYKVSDSTYTKQQIKDAYTTYYQKQNAFETLLSYYIGRESGNVGG